MTPKLAAQIQSEQDHGREKWGRGADDYAHDDATPEKAWHDYIAAHNERARCATPMERRQHLIKLAGLTVSAIEAFDRRDGN